MAQKIIVFAAHPDDEVIGCGGTIARFTAEGNEVHVVYMTDGVSARRPEGEPSIDAAECLARKEAAQAAANILGVQSITFGNFPDNRMDSNDLLDVTQFIEKAIAHHNPELVLTHHAADLNVDHRTVHQAVVTACRPQPGHSVRTILSFEVCSSTEWQFPASNNLTFAPNWFVDISEYFDMRCRALEAYQAEMRDWPHSRSLRAMEHLVRWRGAMVGVEAAEAFMLGRNIIV
jgi:LmbE family N-acetylglucosaminyl deacetylase